MNLKIGIFGDFHICYRELTHVFGELFGFEIRRFHEKLWPSEDASFFRFLSAYTWEELFKVIV